MYIYYFRVIQKILTGQKIFDSEFESLFDSYSYKNNKWDAEKLGENGVEVVRALYNKIWNEQKILKDGNSDTCA